MSTNVLATLNTGGGTDLLKIKASMDKAIAERETAKVNLGAAEKALAAAVAAKNKAIEESTSEKVDLIKEKMRNASKPTVIGQRIWEFLKGSIANMWKPACYYIVFFGVVFLLLYGFSSIFSHNSSINSFKSFGHIQLGNMNPFQVSLYKIKLWFINLFKWFRPGYSVKSALSMFDTNNTMASSIPREVLAGRCDNMTHIEDSKNSECVANHPPDDYKFTIKPESMPDWHLLPDHFKATDQLTLYMPYSSNISASGDNSFYIPKCDQTYYKTAAGVQVPVRMYTDNGLTCSLLQSPSTKHTNDTVETLPAITIT